MKTSIVVAAAVAVLALSACDRPTVVVPAPAPTPPAVVNVPVPAGTVVQVVQAGYTIGERVLRPALVAVSKGGVKAAASE